MITNEFDIENDVLLRCVWTNSDVVIPYGVTSIGSFAFGDCRSLTGIFYGNTKSEWQEIDKDCYRDEGVPSNCVIHCTNGDLTI